MERLACHLVDESALIIGQSYDLDADDECMSPEGFTHYCEVWKKRERHGCDDETHVVAVDETSGNYYEITYQYGELIDVEEISVDYPREPPTPCAFDDSYGLLDIPF